MSFKTFSMKIERLFLTCTLMVYAKKTVKKGNLGNGSRYLLVELESKQKSNNKGQLILVNHNKHVEEALPFIHEDEDYLDGSIASKEFLL